MFRWLKRLLSGPKSTYTAEAKTTNFLKEVRLGESSSEDYPMSLAFEFQNAIGEGNSIAHLNLRVDGTVFQRVGLYAGDTIAAINIKPADDEFEVVAVDTDGHVVAADEVEIREVARDTSEGGNL